MNYLDLLPNDVKKIKYRKVQDLHIIERRKERKKIENNREQSEKQIEKDRFMKSM